MKKFFVIAGAIVSSALFITSCKEGKKGVNMVSHMDSVSYALGMNQGSMLYSQLKTLPGEAIEKDVFLSAFTAAMNDDSTAMKFNQDECVKILEKYFSDLDKIRMEEKQKEAIMNKIKSDSALTANKEVEGVIVTASGLQYKVIEKGSGATPKKDDVVKVKYTGKTVDGKVFDSTDNRGGQPAQFRVDGVIPGWQEGLQLMSVGSKYEFLIPSELAYGERGAGDAIAPNSALFFEVELVEIVKEK